MVLVDGVFRLCRLQSARDGMTSEKQSVGQLRANPTDPGVGLGGTFRVIKTSSSPSPDSNQLASA